MWQVNSVDQYVEVVYYIMINEESVLSFEVKTTQPWCCQQVLKSV